MVRAIRSGCAALHPQSSVSSTRRRNWVLAEPAFRAAILDPQFFEPMPGSPQKTFAAFIKIDAEKWQRVIRVANVKLD